MLNKLEVKILTTESEFVVCCDDWECNNNNGVLEIWFKNAYIIDGFSRRRLESNMIVAQSHFVCAFATGVE